MPVREKLKVLRNVRRITVREVEQASRRIAEAKRDKRYCISNGWLAQLEKGGSEPSICKLFSLSAIYRVQFFDLAQLYGVNLDEIKQFEQVANPHLTQVLSADTGDCDLADPLGGSGLNFAEGATTLVPGARRNNSHNFFCVSASSSNADFMTYGYIGLNDLTMYPLIRPGAIVRIDTSQNRAQAITWHSEYERPIYFIELRNAYACGWCELQGNHLLIIPHPSSPGSIRRFIYRKEAEIVGRVTGFYTRCVDQEPDKTGGANEMVHGRSSAR